MKYMIGNFEINFKDIINKAYELADGKLWPNENNLQRFKNIYLGSVVVMMLLTLMLGSKLFVGIGLLLTVPILGISLCIKDGAKLEKALLIIGLIVATLNVAAHPAFNFEFVLGIHFMNQIQSLTVDKVSSLCLQLLCMAACLYVHVSASSLITMIFLSLRASHVQMIDLNLLSTAICFMGFILGLVVIKPYFKLPNWFCMEGGVRWDRVLDGLRTFVFSSVISKLLALAMFLGGLPVPTDLFIILRMDSVWEYARFCVTHFIVTTYQATFEEILFRGVLQQSLVSIFNACGLPLLVVPMNGALFSLAHGFDFKTIGLSLLRSFRLFMAGMVYSFIAQKEEGIEQVSVMHTLHNLMIFIRSPFSVEVRSSHAVGVEDFVSVAAKGVGQLAAYHIVKEAAPVDDPELNGGQNVLENV